MKLIDWFRPGIRVKRWILLGIMGVLLVFFGLFEIIRTRGFYSIYYTLFYVYLIISGTYVLYTGVCQGMRSVIGLINKGYINVSINSRRLGNLIYEKRLLVKGPKIVAIGGGTGLSTMLRGLKRYTSNITAIVTVADDGGGTGDLREDLGMIAPGDIRNCILALADTEPLMQELLQYRFKDGRLKNQSFGNLFLAAMDGISTTFEEAVQKMSSVLAVIGKVIPVTLDNVKLVAKLKDGTIVRGESKIPEVSLERKSPIDRVFIEPENAKVLDDAIKAVREADAILLGPGSLYTSVIPNLLVKDLTNEIEKSNAIKIYISNIMTQPGETDGYSVEDHIRAFIRHTGSRIVDYVVVNVGKLKDELQNKYLEETSRLVTCDKKKLRDMNINVIEGDFISAKDGLIRHDSDKLASIIIETIMDKKLQFDRKKIIEYFYVSERLKENESSKE